MFKLLDATSIYQVKVLQALPLLYSIKFQCSIISRNLLLMLYTLNINVLALTVSDIHIHRATF